jgi:hypothetical protein
MTSSTGGALFLVRRSPLAGGFFQTFPAGKYLNALGPNSNANYQYAVRGWLDEDGNYVTVTTNNTTAPEIRINRYPPANDYETYLQLPWLMGIACKLKE